MRVLISDDERLARTRLRCLLAEIGGHEVVGEAANGRESLVLCDELAPDVVLLDIRMPGIDGLEAANHLAGYERPPAVIFTTAYNDHALAAFEANAVDYLVKPIRKERLRTALHKAHRLNRAQLAAVREANGSPQARTHICVRQRERVALIPVADILMFRADQKYVSVFHTGGECLIEEPLKDLEQEFARRFLRVHRNTLIAKDYFVGVEKDAGGRYHALLRDSALRAEISRRHLGELKALLKALG